MATLRSLIVKIGADTQNIEKALASVGESAKTLDAGLKKLGTTPLGKQTQQDAERLIKSVQSLTEQQEKLARQSVLAARGLEAVGGPARLTKSELDQVAKSVERGIDAFRALGREAPQELQRVAAAIQQQQRSLKTGISGFGGDLLGGLGLGVGAGAGATLGILVKQTLDAADALSKLSDRTGITAVGLQRLQAIAEPSGNTIEDLAGAINKFQKNLAEGDATAGAALNRIGLSFEQLRQLEPDQQFIEIAKAIQTIKDPADQTLVAMQLFGRGGAEILPSLKAKVDELADSTIKMSNESVAAWDAVGDAVQRAKRSILAAIGEVGGKAIRLNIDPQTALFLTFFGAGFNLTQPAPTKPPVPSQGQILGGNVNLPASPFRTPGLPSDLDAIVKGLNTAIKDSITNANLASEAYRRMQQALEAFAKIGTDSARATRDFSAALPDFPTFTIDVQESLDASDRLVTDTFDDMIRKAKELEDAFRAAFGVSAGASLGLPNVAPGNRDLLNQARSLPGPDTFRDSQRALSEFSRTMGELASVTTGATSDVLRFSTSLVDSIGELREAADAFGASSLDAALAAFRLGIAIGSLFAKVFGGLFSGPGALGDAARRAAAGVASGGVVTAFGIQRFASGGAVLPFLSRGTDTVPALLTPGEWVLNREQQKAVAGAIGGTTYVVNNDNRGSFFGTNAGRELARIVTDHVIDRIDQNKHGTQGSGAFTRLRGALRLPV